MINNYSELVDSIAEELARDDLASNIPEWIQLAESALSKFIRLLDGEQITTGNFTPAQDYIDLPAGFKEPIHFEWQYSSAHIRVPEIVSWDKLTDVKNNDTTGKPRAICYLNRRCYMAPTPTSADAYTLVYYGKPVPLSEDNPTNDLLEMGPEVLKYMALIYSAPFLGDDERLMTWNALVAEGRVLLKKEYWSSKADGGRLRVRPDNIARDSHWQF